MNVLIPGASRGIGRATAVLAGTKGWSVGVNYAADARAADDTATAVRDAGGRAAVLKGDVSSEADVVAAFDAARTCAAAKPRLIVCDTRMGKGVPFLEERERNHFLRVEPEEWGKALDVLDAARPV